LGLATGWSAPDGDPLLEKKTMDGISQKFQVNVALVKVRWLASSKEEGEESCGNLAAL